MRKSKWMILTVGATLGLLCILTGIIGCSTMPHSGGYVGLQPPASILHDSRSPVAIDGMPSAGEELWIIQEPAEAQLPTTQPDLPGTGSLMAELPSSKELIPVPLGHTDVRASITGCIATVDVAQQYHNPYDTKIEAVYVFPLPHDAAVSEFVMTVGERRIRGIIREREEAQRIYDEARAQGYVASLLTQERPNIFTQKVANIEPGKQIDVNIRYFNTLAYADGFFEFVFPMVVGPRFNPPGYTDGVGAVARDARGVSGQKTEVSYLHPTERSGHDISLAVDIDAGVQIENLICQSHHIEHSLNGAKAHIALASDDRIPNRDFVLRYQVAGKTPRSAIFTSRDSRGGYFAMMLIPPIDQSDLPRQPLEMVFTMDVSGSMSGKPIEQSKSAVKYALRHMNAADTF